MLTLDDVRTRLAEIVACADDDEAAQDLDDALYLDVLRALCSGEAGAEAMWRLADTE